MKVKRNREEAESDPPPWRVVRLAARDRETRKKQGGTMKSKQKKVLCEKLEIIKDGCKGTAKGLFFTKYNIQDYNHYRMQGDSRKFEAGTMDRAVSISTVSAYDTLQKALDHTGKIKVERGDLGENILIDGPPATATTVGSKDASGLFVGAKIRVGSALLEVTEANNPCYRFNTQSWAPHAKEIWGNSAPDGNCAKWFKSPQCPLNHQVNPGVRGWLARVVEEGETRTGDQAQLVLGEEEEVEQTEEVVPDAARPFKKQKVKK
ncbi:expressed unknown protein [Seminavis robusta]|uniref:MOSC domain-containing protein n=1 Tax=Seminavis robusta TaxID=568900 RepID=A0A9N8HFI0_9STRA|nr:expressed unknown protein [Seminavis robusta]|eukprot:Sro351_g123830.1 n/a (263) ;mRNA; r:8711-9499